MKVIKKLGKILLLIFLTFIILSIGTIAVFQNTLSCQHKSNPAVLKQSKADSEKQALVIYQPSLLQTTKNTAMSIAQALNQRGYQVTINYPGDYLDIDVSKYSVLVLGSPVYFGQTSSVLNKYSRAIKETKNTKILYFETGANSFSEKEKKTIQQIFPDAKAIVIEKFIANQSKDQQFADEAVEKLCG